MGMMLTYRPGYWGDAPPAPDESDVVGKPLSRRNLVELQETARALGLAEDGSKAELRDRIREHEDAGTVTAKPGDGQPGVDEHETPEGEQPDPENAPDPDESGTQPDPENAPADAPEAPGAEQTEGENTPGE